MGWSEAYILNQGGTAFRKTHKNYCSQLRHTWHTIQKKLVDSTISLVYAKKQVVYSQKSNNPTASVGLFVTNDKMPSHVKVVLVAASLV